MTKLSGNYNIYYAKFGNIVTVQTDAWIGVDAPSSNSWVTLGTLPSAVCPTRTIRLKAGTNGTTAEPEMEISTSGVIRVYAYAGQTNRPEFAVSYFKT